jgi:hypothetical protein
VPENVAVILFVGAKNALIQSHQRTNAEIHESRAGSPWVRKSQADTISGKPLTVEMVKMAENVLTDERADTEFVIVCTGEFYRGKVWMLASAAPIEVPQTMSKCAPLSRQIEISTMQRTAVNDWRRVEDSNP